MWFQGLIYVLLILGFVYAAWRLIVVPVLEANGIKYDDVKVERNLHVQKLERLKDKLEELAESNTAADESLKVLEEMKDLEEKIRETEKKMKGLK